MDMENGLRGGWRWRRRIDGVGDQRARRIALTCTLHPARMHAGYCCYIMVQTNTHKHVASQPFEQQMKEREYSEERTPVNGEEK